MKKPMVYAELFARSSLPKLGCHLSKGVGVIDSKYTGEILVLLTKESKRTPDLILPVRAVQLGFKSALNVNLRMALVIRDEERAVMVLDILINKINWSLEKTYQGLLLLTSK